ncbi:hypothetical protein CEXT_260621 [Caerostris extrusa]|uniref:Uncharacterized protein n=1 Tax=Caerostris extrusa TaxID=172846 RepID=A0AAV4XWX0_CAEEX|nr:hypothetical protein CEXT_260621 [Caerostris extrusa]
MYAFFKVSYSYQAFQIFFAYPSYLLRNLAAIAIHKGIPCRTLIYYNTFAARASSDIDTDFRRQIAPSNKGLSHLPPCAHSARHNDGIEVQRGLIPFSRSCPARPIPPLIR